MATFLIADTHFNDKDIIRYERRPFQDTSEMTKKLIRYWNHVVSPKDDVWHLGDVICHDDCPLHQIRRIIEQLNGTKYLIKGNHDTKNSHFYRHAGFKEVYDRPVLLDGFFLLSHEPQYMNDQTPFANIFGHVHGNPMFNTVSPHSYCVCVERISYKPIALTEIVEQMKCPQPLYDKQQYITTQVNLGANPIIIEFIHDFLTHQGSDKAEILRSQFRAGYCYYFAHILKTAFKRGSVCWAAPFGHFVWKDEDGISYDVEGLYTGEYKKLIPEYYLGSAVQDFLHIQHLIHNTSQEEIQHIINKYKEDQKKCSINLQKYVPTT